MTPDKPDTASAAARTGSGDAVCLSSSSAADLQPNSPPRPNPQAENRASEITCALMRADELRGCLIREISLTMAIALQAQAALLDGDDDAALAILRRHWRVIRAGIAPLACELAALRRARAAP
jgi:hypothetical protein